MFEEFLEDIPFVAEAVDFLVNNSAEIFLFTMGIAVYGVIVWTFYQKISKRDIFESGIRRYERRLDVGQKIFKTFLRMVEYGLVFPIISFISFVVLATLLFLLAKNQPVENIFFLAIAVISAARITSYYSEKLSEDISKLLPLALLGVFLVEPNFFSVELFVQRIESLVTFLPQTFGYVLYLVFLEWVLRVLLFFKVLITGDGKRAEAVQEADVLSENPELKEKILKTTRPRTKPEDIF